MTKRPALRDADARAPQRRCGFTLLEIMTSITLALMLMYSVARIFSRVGSAMNETTSTMEMTNQLRNAKDRLVSDLENLTLVPQPPENSLLNQGFFYYAEGLGGSTDLVCDGGFHPFSSSDLALDSERWERFNAGDSNYVQEDCVDTTVGDLDDIISFTAKAPVGRPFRGRWRRPVVTDSGVSGTEPAVFESEYAEIVWFVRGTTLYRRVLPLMSNKQLQESLYNLDVPNTAEIRNGFGFYQHYDVSVHLDENMNIVANTLGDLSNRANRYFYWNSFGRHIKGAYGIVELYGGSVAPPNDPNDPNAPNGAIGAKLHGQFGAWYWLRMPTLQESASSNFRAGMLFGGWYLQNLQFDAEAGRSPLPAGSYSALGLPMVNQPFVDYWNNPNFWQTNADNAENVSVDSETGDLALYAYPNGANAYNQALNSDVVLTNVLSFNVKAWDPNVSAYVDLGSGVADGTAPRADSTNLRSGGYYADNGYYNNDIYKPLWTATPCVYDTWTEQYQRDYFAYADANPAYVANGSPSDLPLNSAVSSSVLQNYPPPYDVPLKSLQIELRVFDPRSKHIRNATFVVNLTKE